ncbi:MAG: homoserine O-acetyltransferase, partial [Armatimonadetes bacterium]|nr:homoserine O-acetyltransferase [Armatimonadota bacterium]
EKKFGRSTKPLEDKREQFQVESYLQHQGEKFTHRFDANSLIVLSDAIDLYEYRHEPKADTDYLITSFVSDWIYPSHLSAELASLIGVNAVHHDLPSPLGHDSFLLDDVHQAPLVTEFFGVLPRE